MHTKEALTAVVLLFVGWLGSSHAQAMSIEAFARMNNDDEATYVTEMVSGASDLLKAQGHPDQAAKALALFKDPSDDGGVHQFALNLKLLNGQNKRNAINPNNRAPLFTVEDAMELTLRDKGILVSASDLLAMNKDFHPGIPRQHAPNT